MINNIVISILLIIIPTKLNNLYYKYEIPTRFDMDIIFALAIAKVESNFNYFAYNKHENAHGILQIRPIALRCVNEFYNTRYAIEDCYTNKSFTIMKLYLNRWGNGMSYYDKARIWNGGACGHKKKSTIRYAKMVIEEMNNIKKN